jgi:glycosyltransferase involved in cell wall biosynthesis
MKVLQAYPYFTYPVIGGMDQVLFYSSTYLARNRHQVTILAGNMNHLTTTHRYIGNVHVQQIPTFRVAHHLEFPLTYLPNIIREYDLINVHSLGHIFTNYIAKTAINLAKPVVVSWLSLQYMVKHLPSIAKPMGNWLVNDARTIVKLAQQTYVLNYADYKTVTQLVPAAKVQIIPCGISRLFFRLPPKGAEFRARYGLEHRKIILYVGRIDRWKGVEVLAKTIPQVIAQNPEIFYIFVGTGPFLASLQRIIQVQGADQHVLFTGFLSEEEKIAAYDAADLVVIPSMDDYIEAFCIVASEAWARAKPIVASEIGALRHRVQPQINGFLVPPNDPNKLADAIVHAFGFSIKQAPPDVVNWEKVSQMYEAMFTSITKSRK